jgi:hypothetical protein
VYPFCRPSGAINLGPQVVQPFHGQTKGSRASGDLTKVQEKAKRIAGSRLAGGNASRTVTASSTPAQAGREGHLSMEDALDRENRVS